MKNLSKILFVVALFSANYSLLKGQNIVFRMDTVVSEPNQEVTIGVYASALQNVGAMTLYINYDNTNLTWVGPQNWHPQLDNGYNLVNSTGSVIAIAWFDSNPVTTGPVKIVDLRFAFGANNATLTFANGSEIANGSGVPITGIQFKPGFVVRKLAVNATANKTISCAGSNVQLNAVLTGGYGATAFQWASEPAGFSSTLQNPTATPSVNTRYFVTVTQGAYWDTSSVLVTMSQALQIGNITGMIPVDSATGLNETVLFSWIPVANATHYDLWFWKEGWAVPANPQITDITSISQSVGQQFSFDSRFYWKLTAKNECFSQTSAVQTFRTLALPELHVTNVSHSYSKANQTIQVSWTVRNDGNGPTTTPLWYDRVWIAPDIEVRVGEPEDKLIGTYPNLTALAPGQSYTQTRTIPLPPNMIGTFFIFVVTDALDALFINPGPGGFQIPYSPPPYLVAYSHGGSGVNLVREVSDSGPYHDNFFYTPVTFPIPPLPELQVTAVAAPISSFSGQAVTVNWRVENFGSASTQEILWHDKIYLSADQSLDAADPLLKTVQHVGRLDPDSSYQTNTTVTLPNFISGPHYILVHTDAMNVNYEHAFDENNITSSDTLNIILTPPPDLVVTNITVTDTASNAQDIMVRWTVQNQGATPPLATSWSDRIYLSEHATLNTSNAHMVGVESTSPTSFQPGQTYTLQRNIRIPAHINGPYYLFIHTDQQNQVFESLGDTNNITRRSTPITIISPDLSPGNLTVPPVDSTGDELSYTWITRNLGPGSLQNQSWADRLFVSFTPLYQPSVSQQLQSVRRSSAIPAGGTISSSNVFRIPANYGEGTYYLHSFNDALAEVFENGMDNNNVSSVAAFIQVVRPDLTVRNIQFPVSAGSGKPLNLSYTVNNIGSGAVLGKTRRDQIWLSKSPLYHPDSIISLGTLDRLTTLEAGDSVTTSYTATIPNGISGYYYIMIYTDITDVIPEGNRHDNNRVISDHRLLVDLSPWPDLVIDTIMIPDTVTAGLLQQIQFIVRNQGYDVAQGAAWSDRLYLSPSSFWNPAAITPLGSQLRSLQVDPDSSYTVSFNITLPASLNAGQYYLYAVTDETNVLFEHIDEDNNRLRSKAIYFKSYPVNLAVSQAIRTGDTANSGQNMSLSWTVTNVGQVPTLGNQWIDALYLSPDDKFSPATDLLLRSWDVNGPLAIGSNYHRTRQFSAPYGISGDYYLFMRNDRNGSLKDLDYSDNHLLVTDASGNPTSIHINEVPTPDLVVRNFSAPVTVLAGQSFRVYWTVVNQGQGTLDNVHVTDGIYRSNDLVINSGDILTGTRSRLLFLAPGDSLVDSLDITITAQTTANYVLILRTDNADKVYEHNAEENNTAAVYLAVAVAPPSDLIVTAIQCPDTLIVGRKYNLQWTVGNQGTNPANGPMTDGLYISQDPVLDNADLLIGQFMGNVNIIPGTSVNRQLNVEIPGVADGQYYLIAVADVKNNINETNDTNNSLATPQLIQIQMQPLYVDYLQLDTLSNGELIYYKLELDDTLLGETVLITLLGDSLNGNNEMFVGFNRAPSRIVYDRRSPYNFEGNQEVVIPQVMPGNYYLMVTGNTTSSTWQPISLYARKVNFEVRSWDPKRGGNSGKVTVRIDGSKFEPDMDVFLELVNPGPNDLVYSYAEELFFVDPSLVFASFKLEAGQYVGDDQMEGMKPGIYNMHLVKPHRDSLVVDSAFEVYAGGMSRLLVNIIHPPNVRSGRYFPMSLQYANGGDFDIPTPRYAVMSMFGAPLGFTVEELQFGLTDLYVEFTDPFGPPGFLRPGAAWTITLFSYSSTRLVFRLVPYNQ